MSDRVVKIAEAYAKGEGFIEIRSPGKTDKDAPAPSVLARSSGKAAFRGLNLFQGGRGHHLIQLAEVAPGNRKYLHRHHHAETVWVILEGEGEFYPDQETAIPVSPGTLCHAYPWEWHGMANTGDHPLRYLSIEGPMFLREGSSEFAE